MPICSKSKKGLLNNLITNSLERLSCPISKSWFTLLLPNYENIHATLPEGLGITLSTVRKPMKEFRNFFLISSLLERLNRPRLK